MNRRAFLIGVAAAVTPRAARGQSAARPAKLGFLAQAGAPVFNRFVAGLRDRGWSEGENLTVVIRLWGEHPARAREMATELVASGADVILAVGPAAAAAAKDATTRIPIVMLFAVDPVRFGLAQTLERPGGNLTGLTWDTGVDDYTAKMLEVFTTALPAARTFAMLWNRDDVALGPYFEAGARVLSGLGRRMVPAAMRTGDELDAVFRRIKADRAEALVVYPDAVTFLLRDAIMTRAIAQGLPTLVTADLFFREALIVFAPHVAEMPARAAGFVDRILRGAAPAELPIEQPTKYDLKIDLRVASRLGVTVPLALLLRADRVLE